MEIQITKDTKLIKDLRVALKDFEPMVKDPKFLWNGREIPNFKLLPREAWANWLICTVLQKMHGRDFTFMEDSVGDGYIIDKNTKGVFPTEHVSALEIPLGKNLPKGERRIIDAINLKIARGADYANQKILVVFFDGAGEFFRDKIRENIYGKHSFEAIFCVGLLESNDENYCYSVTEFRDSFKDLSITHKVEINGDFTDWKIIQIMQ